MQNRSEETRLRLLEAASRLFSEYGYDGTGVAEICSVAGISKGAFYYHYPTKQALFVALLETWLSGLDIVFQKIQQEARTVPEALMAMAHTAGNVLQSSDTNASIIIEFWMQAYRDPAIWEAAKAPYRRYQDYFAALIQKGILEGSILPVDPQVAARVTVSLGMGLLLQALVDNQTKQWDDEVQKSVEMLLNGLSRRNI